MSLQPPLDRRFAHALTDYLTYTFLYDPTGNMDSTLLTHSFFTANGASPDTFSYAATPTYINVPSWEYSIVYEDTTSYTETEVGTAMASISAPFWTAYPVERTQIVWTAAELTAAGMVAGNISGLDFNFA